MEPTIGKHDFSGACAPAHPQAYSDAAFSVGIFEWVKSSTKRPKKSKVKVRVRGWASRPEAVYARAREIVAKLDAGTYDGAKVVELARDW